MSRISTATTRRPSRTTTRLSPRRRGCPGRLALYYTSYQPRQPGHFLPQPFDRPAARHRRIFRLEHERGGFAGRLEGGDDFEPERQPERLGVQRGRHGFEAVDDGRRRMIVAVLVAGRPMDLFRDQNSSSAACWRKFRRAAARCNAFRTSGASNPTEPDWSPDGKWIAFTSQMGEFDICVVPADGGTAHGAGAGRRSVVVAELAHAGFQPRARATGSRCLCLTYSRNKSRILAGFRETIPNPPGRNNFAL